MEARVRAMNLSLAPEEIEGALEEVREVRRRASTQRYAHADYHIHVKNHLASESCVQRRIQCLGERSGGGGGVQWGEVRLVWWGRMGRVEASWRQAQTCTKRIGNVLQ